MLFGNKKEEFAEKLIKKLEILFEQKLNQQLEEKLAPFERELELLRQEAGIIKEEVNANSAKNEALVQNVGRFQTELHKHDMSIEDLMEVWEERSSGEKEARNHMQEYAQSEKKLLDLFEAYQEQFFQMKRFAGEKDEAWKEQLALMEEKLEQCRRECGISIISGCGIPVNYELHEIIEVKDTDDLSKDNLISDIYRCGYIYKGRILKKAQAAAYRAKITESDAINEG